MIAPARRIWYNRNQAAKPMGSIGCPDLYSKKKKLPEQGIGIDDLMAIARALDVTIGQILGEEPLARTKTSEESLQDRLSAAYKELAGSDPVVINGRKIAVDDRKIMLEAMRIIHHVVRKYQKEKI